MTGFRTSPVHVRLVECHARFATVLGMPAAVEIGTADAQRVAVAAVVDVSCLDRTGLKGPGAAAWLAERGIPVPGQPNRWCASGEDGLVARLARTEFLLEGAGSSPLVPLARAGLRAGIEGVYPVLRQDCALLLAGERVPELLAQTCNVDLSGQDEAQAVVTLTQMVGVSVTILRQRLAGRAVWRVWCDYANGPYLWETLAGIAEELGGGPAGIAAAWPALGADGTVATTTGGQGR